MFHVSFTLCPLMYLANLRFTTEGGHHLKILFRYAVKQVLSREEMRIRLSRWLSFAVYTGLRSERCYWRDVIGLETYIA